MSRALSPSISPPYGLARVARVWNVSRAAIYRFRSDTRSDTSRVVLVPSESCSDAELAEHTPPTDHRIGFHGEGYRKIWAGCASPAFARALGGVRRVMGEHGLLRGASPPDGPRPRRIDGTIVTRQR